MTLGVFPKLRVAFWIALPVGLVGLSYEFGYFYALGLFVWDYLSISHYLLSGITIIFLPVVIVSLYAMVRKFFSRSIASDDLAAFKENLKEADLKSEIAVARMSFVFTLIFLVLVQIDFRHPTNNSNLSDLYLYFMFANVVLFLRGLILLPPHSKASALIVLLLSLNLCAYAGGTGAAREAMVPVLRDDIIVKVVRQEAGGYEVSPRQLPINVRLIRPSLQLR